MSSVGFTVAYDTRNLPQSPTSGIFSSFSEDFAGVGGDVNYFRSVVDTRGYYPLTPKVTLVGRVQGGFINGWGGEDVRMTDLFFKGGETIRGFERAGIGPRDACEDPVLARASRIAPRIRWAARPSGRRPPKPASRFPSFPTISACRARSLSMPDRCGCRADLPKSAVASRRELHQRRSGRPPVDRRQPHLAIAARTAPRRSRAGLAQGLLRPDRDIPLWRFDRLLGACFCPPLGVIS